MKFLTCNIRRGVCDDGINSFEYRKPYILEKFMREQPDVACFQEVMPFVADWLTDSLTDYVVIGCGRSRELDDEQMTIAFRRNKYTLIHMETFWFSPYPHYAGSRYVTMSNWPRTCTEAVLRERATGELFRVCNLHMDNLYDIAREQAVKQLMEKLRTTDVFDTAHIIIAGDFNAEPGDASICRMDPAFRDAAACSGPTYHGYRTAEPPVKIDYIWVKDDIEASDLQVWDEHHLLANNHFQVHLH